MKDRFVDGLIAGVVAAIVAGGFNLVLNSIFDVRAKHFIDFAEVMLFGHKAHNWTEFGVAFVGYAIFSGIIGIVYGYSLPAFSHRYHLLKGVFVSLAIWFLVFSLVQLAKHPHFTGNSLYTTIMNFASAAVFGLVLDLVYFRLRLASERA